MSPHPSVPFRSPALLNRQDSRLVIIDMQERLLQAMPEAPRAIAGCMLLVQGAQLLGVPVCATEQYPRGLGPTVEPLRTLLGPVPEKLRFSSTGAWDWAAAAGDAVRPKVVVAGIETHVCVQQTCLDLLAAGFSVYVAADAVASRFDVDYRWALARLRDSGVVITTAEAVLFEWCETAEAESFKQLSALVKGRTAPG